MDGKNNGRVSAAVRRQYAIQVRQNEKTIKRVLFYFRLFKEQQNVSYHSPLFTHMRVRVHININRREKLLERKKKRTTVISERGFFYIYNIRRYNKALKKIQYFFVFYSYIVILIKYIRIILLLFVHTYKYQYIHICIYKHIYIYACIIYYILISPAAGNARFITFTVH